MKPLAPRHREVLEAASRGLTARQIAAELGNEPNTVRELRAQAIRRMGARNITEACVKYERERAAFEARDRLSEAIQKWVRTTHRTLDAPKEVSA